MLPKNHPGLQERGYIFGTTADCDKLLATASAVYWSCCGVMSSSSDQLRAERWFQMSLVALACKFASGFPSRNRNYRLS